MNDPMISGIDKVFAQFPEFEGFRFPIYKRAAELVVEEEYHSDDEIYAVIMSQVVKVADLNDERKKSFASALTLVIAKARDAARRGK